MSLDDTHVRQKTPAEETASTSAFPAVWAAVALLIGSMHWIDEWGRYL